MQYHNRLFYYPSIYLLTGATLKKVDPNESSSAAPSDGRSALLDAIRKGAELKHVSVFTTFTRFGKCYTDNLGEKCPQNVCTSCCIIRCFIQSCHRTKQIQVFKQHRYLYLSESPLSGNSRVMRVCMKDASRNEETSVAHPSGCPISMIFLKKS